MNRRILIVDDEPDFLEIYQEILTSSGPMSAGSLALKVEPKLDFELTTCQNKDEPLKLIEKAVATEAPYAGMFLDLGKKPTLDVLRRARLADPNLLFVLTTSDPNPNLDEIQKLFGIDFADRWDILLKPFSQYEITQKAYGTVSDWDRRFREREYLKQIHSQQEQLLRTERLAAMGNLARNLGREFGNIIQTILTRADLAMQKNEITFMAQSLKAIIDTCEKAGPIVRNLQTLSQTDSRRDLIALDVFVKDAVGLIQLEAKKSNVKVVEEYETPSPRVTLSRHEMNQAVLNIALNAIQAMQPKGGTLTLKTVGDKDGVSLFIKDTGIGIPEENLAKIFEPLFTTKAGFGTGLGVSATKRIVETHGGKISVASTVGAGTTFRIWLPKV